MTINTQNRDHRFGKVEETGMILNTAGEMVSKWIKVVENKFKEIRIDDYVIMPDHVHLLIMISPRNEGADRRVCPIIEEEKSDYSNSETGKHVGLPLHRVVQWIKTMTTNEYIRGVREGIWPRFDKRLWQRNYNDRIVRDGRDLFFWRYYIQTNPEVWYLKNLSLNKEF